MRWRALVRALALLPAIALGGGVADSHHSIASVYDQSKPLTLRGVVVRFEFINPHPFITLEVKDERGAAEVWKLEMDNMWELAEIGFSDGTLKPGDVIVVSGSIARREQRSLYIRRLERPADGFRYDHT
jgi:hypothetical protein